ncbi:MAG: Bifunctional PGK [Syntrophus sp. PtaB.Bin001]|nr:MAG: Bifunctional PGK [Syntrophus sp. PtaB.Bin001]
MYKTVRESVEFVTQLKKELPVSLERDVLIAPTFPSLYPVSELLKGTSIRLGAQNLHEAKEGAYTGEVSAAMLCDAGCEYVIIGHSERRTLFGETDAVINKKIIAACGSGLKPIFCIGETLAERESGKTFEVLEKQLKEGLNSLDVNDIRHLVIAYEPVWAIGTGKTATPEQAQEAHAFIRSTVGRICGADFAAERVILYGGSVNPGNISSLMLQSDINGALVGGASLNVDSFVKIILYD